MLGAKAYLACRKGAAAAEMALLLPLMVLILLGMFEGGYYMYSQHLATKGVRDGARFAARQSFTKYNCATAATPPALTDVSDTALVADVQNITRSGRPDGTAQPYLPGWAASDVTVQYNCDSATSTGMYRSVAGGAPRVQVTANVAYVPLFGMLGFDTSNIRLRAEAQAAVMGI